MFESRRGALTAPKKRTFKCTLITFLMIMPSLQIQYFSMYFLAAKIGDNKFVNCSLIGLGEMIGGLISGFLMTRIHDHHVFISSALATCLANFAFYFMPVGGA